MVRVEKHEWRALFSSLSGIYIKCYGTRPLIRDPIEKAQKTTSYFNTRKKQLPFYLNVSLGLLIFPTIFNLYLFDNDIVHKFLAYINFSAFN